MLAAIAVIIPLESSTEEPELEESFHLLGDQMIGNSNFPCESWGGEDAKRVIRMGRPSLREN